MPNFFYRNRKIRYVYILKVKEKHENILQCFETWYYNITYKYVLCSVKWYFNYHNIEK